MLRIARILLCSLIISGCIIDNESSDVNDDIDLEQSLISYFDSIYVKHEYLSKEMIELAGAAPPLTSHQIAIINSTKFPSPESIGELQFTTTRDHGGDIGVGVLEIGTSSSRFGYFNGSLMAAGTSTVYYNSKKLAYAYLRTWTVKNRSSGEIKTKATNSMQPWNTLSDYIYVK